MLSPLLSGVSHTPIAWRVKGALGDNQALKTNTRCGTRGEDKRPWRDGKTMALNARLAEAGIQRPLTGVSLSKESQVFMLGSGEC